MSEQQTAAPDEIKTVRAVTKDGGSYCVKCPHCGDLIAIEGDDMSQVRGEQFQHKRREWQGPRGLRSSGCNGWLQVSPRAVFLPTL